MSKTTDPGKFVYVFGALMACQNGKSSALNILKVALKHGAPLNINIAKHGDLSTTFSDAFGESKDTLRTGMYDYIRLSKTQDSFDKIAAYIERGYTPLHVATALYLARLCGFELLDFLTKNGADVNAVFIDFLAKNSLATNQAEFNNLDATVKTKYLKEHPEAIITPLRLAASKGHTLLVEYFLNHRSNFTKTDIEVYYANLQEPKHLHKAELYIWALDKYLDYHNQIQHLNNPDDNSIIADKIALLSKNRDYFEKITKKLFKFHPELKDISSVKDYFNTRPEHMKIQFLPGYIPAEEKSQGEDAIDPNSTLIKIDYEDPNVGLFGLTITRGSDKGQAAKVKELMSRPGAVIHQNIYFDQELANKFIYAHIISAYGTIERELYDYTQMEKKQREQYTELLKNYSIIEDEIRGNTSNEKEFKEQIAFPLSLVKVSQSRSVYFMEKVKELNKEKTFFDNLINHIKEYWFPLFPVVQKEMFQTMIQILKVGADPKLTIPTSAPLAYLNESDQIKFMDLCEQKNFSMHQEQDLSVNALTIAASIGSAKALEILIFYGGNLRIVDAMIYLKNIDTKIQANEIKLLEKSKLLVWLDKQILKYISRLGEENSKQPPEQKIIDLINSKLDLYHKALMSLVNVNMKLVGDPNFVYLNAHNPKLNGIISKLLEGLQENFFTNLSAKYEASGKVDMEFIESVNGDNSPFDNPEYY